MQGEVDGVIGNELFVRTKLDAGEVGLFGSRGFLVVLLSWCELCDLLLSSEARGDGQPYRPSHPHPHLPLPPTRLHPPTGPQTRPSRHHQLELER